MNRQDNDHQSRSTVPSPKCWVQDRHGRLCDLYLLQRYLLFFPINSLPQLSFLTASHGHILTHTYSHTPHLPQLRMKLTNVALALLHLPSALAWGGLGHETVAYIATNFVQPRTKTFFQGVLHNQTNDYLAGVATWADSFRYTAAGRFSAPFHFIDAEDSPPGSCGVKYSRDCGVKGCVVGAILNYVSLSLRGRAAKKTRTREMIRELETQSCG